MSEGQDGNPPYQPPAGQGYQPPAGQGWQAPAGQGWQPPAGQGWQPPAGQAYQPPPGQSPYPPAPYQQPYPPGYWAGYPGQPMQVVPKNAAVALLISFLLPGVGSMYAGKTNTGIGILVGYIISWVLVIVFIGILGIIAFWVWGMIDAYQAAQAWNRARGIES
jgi:TM2 domain-containing membrane protein YozV